MQLLSVIVAFHFGFTPIVQAAQAYVQNKCDFNVYLWSVDADGSSQPHILAPGDDYNEPYRTPSVGGVSLKLSRDDNPSDPITQFEYTLGHTLASLVFFDVSNVNCQGTACPFHANGMYMESAQGCPTRSCAAGEAPCKGAYTDPKDDHNTVACGVDQDIKLFLCTPHAPAPQKRAIESPKAEPMANLERRHLRRHGHAHVRL